MIKRKLLLIGMSMAMLTSVTGCGNSGSGLETVDVNATVSTAETIAPTVPSSSETESAQTLPTETETTPVVETIESSAAPDPVAEGFTPVSQIVAPNTNLKLRVGPGTDFASAGLLAAGTQVTRFSIGEGWSQIYYNDIAYYVASDYLTLIADGARVEDNPVVPGTIAPVESPAQSEAPQPTAPVTPAPGEDMAPGDPRAVAVQDFSGWSLEQLATLDNTDVPYGFSTKNRDQYNRPSGTISYYYNLYAAYGAEFIAPCTNTIYLTMDEGYEAGYTPIILDTLKAKNVKAVFFLTKQFVTEHPELVTRMIEEGHVLGNHTCAHPGNGIPQMGLEAEYNDLTWLNNYVYEHWGYNMTLFRYPTGTFSIQSLALVNKMGMTPVFWSFAHADWNRDNQPDVASSLQNILNQCHPGAIYLLHAVSETNTALLGDFIDGARALGYEFGVYPSTGF